jgi:hypothetical protein
MCFYSIRREVYLKPFIAIIGVCACMFFFGSFFTVQAAQNSSPASAKNPVAKNKIFKLNSEYGPVGFRGVAERIDLADEGAYEFVIHLEVQYRPGETRNGYIVTNRTPYVDLRVCEFVATKFPKKDYTQVQSLHRDTIPISIQLVRKGEKALMPEMKFRISKAVYGEATHVGLAVVGNSLAWPVPVELKKK